MDNNWINQFREDQDNLVNLTTTAVATTESANVSSTWFQNWWSRTSGIHNKSSRKTWGKHVNWTSSQQLKRKLKTFSDLHTKKVKCKGREIVPKPDTETFLGTRLLLFRVENLIRNKLSIIHSIEYHRRWLMARVPVRVSHVAWLMNQERIG